jgi:predicted amidohydrolase YtcJ
MKSRYSPHPDLILHSGRIRTFAGNGSNCEALACAGGRIVATGSSDEIQRLAGPDTESFDLKGRTVIPGLTGQNRQMDRNPRNKRGSL